MATPLLVHKRLSLPHLYSSIALCFICISICATSAAEDLDMDALLNMDIQQLMNIPVTLASKNENKLFTTAAASSVITREDIQRSGLQSIPELLRLIPGMHVGKFDASKWAISSRNSPSQFSGSMLVMIDNRIVYTPLFGGTYWEVQDYVLHDIERIEVIRGAGGSVWGANASNGVVNIITRSAYDTTGGYAQAAIGEGEIQADASARYGFSFGEGAMRIYAKSNKNEPGEYLSADESTNSGLFPVGNESYDDGQFNQTGFRYDIGFSNNESFTLQGDYSEGALKDTRRSQSGAVAVAAENDIDTRNANMMARWHKPFSDGQTFNLLAYYDLADRVDDGFDDHRETFNIELQHNAQLDVHHISWGIELRQIHDDTATPVNNSAITARLALDPTDRRDKLQQFFIQDEISLHDDLLLLTLGTRIENNDYTGNESQPNVRLALTPDETTTYWLAFSKTVRTPSRGDSDFHLQFSDFNASCDFLPPPFTNDPALGCILPINIESLEADITKSLELGYRYQLSENSLLDVASFYNDITNHVFDDTQPGRLGVRDGKAYGFEIDYRYNFNDNLRLSMWYAKHKGYSDDEGGVEQRDNLTPEDSAHFRVYWDMTPHWQLDALSYYSSKTDNNAGNVTLIKALKRLDLHVGWQAHKQVKLNLYLTNILEDIHGETNNDTTRVNTGTPRGVLFSTEVTF